MMLELLILGALAAAPAPRVVDQGIAVDFNASASASGAPASSPAEHAASRRQPEIAKAGDPIAFTFGITDTATSAPIGGARPAAWLALRAPNAPPPKDCTRQVAKYLGGDLFGRPELDLNAYFVLALNDDASISVVDPLFGFGGSKLLAMLPLKSKGEDWALATDQRTLFVSMPEAGEVAVADTWRWEIAKNVATGPHPRRLLMGERLWVADDEGLTAIDTKTFAATRIRFGATRDVVLSADGALVFAAIENAIVIIDAHQASEVGRVAIDGKPSLLAYSSAGKTLYAADANSGRIFAVDPRAKKVVATIEAHPGATQIRFAPNGRHALIANPERNVVQVLDAATNRIVQNAEIGDGPDRITFTPLLAYVRRRASETVLMIPLEQIGIEGKQLGAADFPGGQHGYADGTGGDSVADSIVEAPEGPSVLVANPADKMIYLYKEGMAAPAGGFSTYGREPRAVLVVDRGLREAKPGHYETTMPVTKAGTYDVVFFLDAPRVVACFAMTIAPREEERKQPVTRVTSVAPPAHLVPGERARLRFALSDAEKGAPRHATDVRALAFEAPGIWQQRGEVTRLDDGTYAFEFIPPDSGMYYVWLESESLGLGPNNSQFVIFEAR